jgi:hypothetical protein
LVAPYRKAENPGCGKHYQSPHRLRSIELLHHDFGKDLGAWEREFMMLLGGSRPPLALAGG